MAAYGKDHPNVAIRLNNLAVLLQDSNCFAEAEPLFRRAISIDEATFGKNHPAVAGDINNLACLLHATNRLEEAEPLMQRMVGILVKFTCDSGHQHLHLETVVGNYLHLLIELGDTQTEADDKINKILAPLHDL